MQTQMLEIACVEGRKKLDDQLSTVDSIDQKIGILIGFAGVVLALLSGHTPDRAWPLCIRLVAQGLILVSLVLFFFGFRSARLKTGLKLKGFSQFIKQFSQDHDPDRLLRYHLAYLAHSVSSNNELISYKSSHLAYGSAVLLAGFVAGVVSSIL